MPQVSCAYRTAAHSVSQSRNRANDLLKYPSNFCETLLTNAILGRNTIPVRQSVLFLC